MDVLAAVLAVSAVASVLVGAGVRRAIRALHDTDCGVYDAFPEGD